MGLRIQPGNRRAGSVLSYNQWGKRVLKADEIIKLSII
jgi:hypothetical protein